MSQQTSPRSWDHNIGMVLAVLGGFILLVKLKIHTIVFSLWPVALIFLGWKMYRNAEADDPRSRRRGRRPTPQPGEDGDQDLDDDLDDEDPA